MTSAEIALPQGFALQEYRIESTLGVGGFGLTYLATDRNLNMQVAIKEYLPADLAMRCDDQSVRSRSDRTLETFNWGRERFLDESRTLAALRHPNIVRVMRFFEANQTAYMVMEFVAGQALNEWIRTRRPVDEQTVVALAVALLDGMEVIHRAGFVHRDIKPGNIFMREDGRPVLLDFGSARVSAADTERTAIVSAGYAPLEQYHAHGNQGPWSDLYALGGVMYWALSGEKPIEATARVPTDQMKPIAQVADRSRYCLQLLDAIDWALAPAERSRPQSAAQLREVLLRSAFESASDVNSVFIGRTQLPDQTIERTTVLASTVFDADAQKKMAGDLARHIGPVAAVVVKSAAKKVATIEQLVDKVALEIADQVARAAFIKKHLAQDRTLTTRGPVSATRARTHPAGVVSARQEFEPALLARVESDLAQYIGAVARAVVRRGAARAHNETELYNLLASEIDDPAQRKLFLRRAMSVSGRA